MLALIAVWIVAEAAAAAPGRPEPGTLALPTGVALLIGQVAAIAAGPAGSRVGLVVAAAGVALRIWAIRTLGDAFRTALDTPRLVATGPYRWLRHPSELGLVVIAAGGAIASASWVAGAAVVVVAVLGAVRCRRENAVLRRSQRIVAEPQAPSWML